MNVNYVWLEMKIEIDENNPLLDIKSVLKEKNIKVMPYMPLVNNKGYFIEFETNHKARLTNVIEKIIKERSENENGIQIVANSQRFVNEKEFLDCWVKSPSLDLITSCTLYHYNLLPTAPSEYFNLFGIKKNLLKDVLMPAFNKVGKDPAKLDWAFRDGPYRFVHNFLTMLETYKWNTACNKRFLVSRNPEVLAELAKELSIVTGTEYKKEKLMKDIDDITRRICKDAIEWATRR